MVEHESTELEGDREAIIRDFVKTLHEWASGLDGELVLVAIEETIRQQPRRLRIHRFPPGAAVEMGDAAIREAAKEWVNVYFGSYVVRKGLPPNSRGSRQDIVAVLALGVDRDSDKNLEGVLPLEPNLVVRTSHLPTINRQAFYVLDPQDRKSIEKASEIGNLLRMATGADSGTGDIARIFRMPGTLNWPTTQKIARGRPRSPQLAVIERSMSGYTSLDALAETLSAFDRNDSLRISDECGDWNALVKRSSARLRKLCKLHDNGGDRSSAAFAAIKLAMCEGFTDQEIHRLVQGHKLGVGERYQGPKGADLMQDIRRIRTKWEQDRGTCDQLLRNAKEVGLPEDFARDGENDLVRLDNLSGETRKVCAFIEVTARVRDKESAGWGLVVRFDDADARTKEVIIPSRDLSVTAGDRDPVGKLRDQGLQVHSTAAPAEIRDYLTRSRPTVIARSIDRTGWQGNCAFALPGRVIGSPDEPLLWSGEFADPSLYEAAGALTDWQASVAEPAGTHPLLVAALCQSLVGPTLELCGGDGFGMHLFGKSSSGKTTAAEIAASVWGNPDRFVKSWRTTVNGLEGIAAAQSEVLLVMDELKQATPDDVGHALYMLSQGIGKQRAGRAGQVRCPKTWSIAYLSTGEISTRAYINSGFGRKATAGQQVRCLDIRVPPNTGVFREGSSPQANATLANDLKSGANQHYGTAGVTFLQALVGDKGGYTQKLSALREEFRKSIQVDPILNSQPDGQVLRAVDQFALLYSAGCLACDAGVFPFSRQHIVEAASQVLRQWIDERGGLEADEDCQAVEAVRGFLQVNKSRFVKIRDDDFCNSPMKPAGYYLRQEGLFAIFPSVWGEEVCAGLDAKHVASKLFALGYLVPEISLGKLQKVAKKISIDGQRLRLVCIKAAILDEGIDGEPDGTIDALIFRS